MAEKVTINGLSDAILHELNVYNKDATRKVNFASKSAAQELVQMTRATAPMRKGRFASSIDSKKLETRHGCETWVWYVKPPLHRITHLLVHGHATRNGGRVGGSTFLHDAWEVVRKKYEKAVEDAFR